jgi:hypothetical protein
MPPRLRTLLGDHRVTRAMKSGEIRAADLDFDFAEVKVHQEDVIVLKALGAVARHQSDRRRTGLEVVGIG